VETGDAEAPLFTKHFDWHLVHQQVEQHRDAPYPSHLIALIGVLQTAVQLFDSRTTALYPEAHGWLLLVGCLACVLGEIHPCAQESQPGISNSFSEVLYHAVHQLHGRLLAMQNRAVMFGKVAIA